MVPVALGSHLCNLIARKKDALPCLFHQQDFGEGPCLAQPASSFSLGQSVWLGKKMCGLCCLGHVSTCSPGGWDTMVDSPPTSRRAALLGRKNKFPVCTSGLHRREGSRFVPHAVKRVVAVSQKRQERMEDRLSTMSPGDVRKQL